ncbi:unnamed protein product, partial [Laminaria digitata]
SYALNEANPCELLSAVANTMTDLCDRVNQLEQVVERIESRFDTSCS